jgi:hypothetical protein
MHRYLIPNFNPSQTTNAENTYRKSSTSSSKVWLSLRRYSLHSYPFHKLVWTKRNEFYTNRNLRQFSRKLTINQLKWLSTKSYSPTEWYPHRTKNAEGKISFTPRNKVQIIFHSTHFHETGDLLHGILQTTTNSKSHVHTHFVHDDSSRSHFRLFYNKFSLRSSLFCDVTQRRLVVSHRRFETNYRSHVPRIKQSKKMGPIPCPESSLTTNLLCVTSQKSADLIYIATEAWNHTFVLFTYLRFYY